MFNSKIYHDQTASNNSKCVIPDHWASCNCRNDIVTPIVCNGYHLLENYVSSPQFGIHFLVGGEIEEVMLKPLDGCQILQGLMITIGALARKLT